MFSTCKQSLNCLKKFNKPLDQLLISKCEAFSSTPNYVQGQSPERKIREYFYYIDHQGMVSRSIKTHEFLMDKIQHNVKSIACISYLSIISKLAFWFYSNNMLFYLIFLLHLE